MDLHASTGRVVWITGLPAAGKTTLALALARDLEERGVRCSRVDGDDLRAGPSRGLGFDREGRRQNARLATRRSLDSALAGAVVLTSLVSPFRSDRAEARTAVEQAGAGFIEVFVDTPLDECRRRDPKGLYAAAADGRLVGLTGWDAPYERPLAPEVHLAPRAGIPMPVDQAAAAVLAVLAALAE